MASETEIGNMALSEIGSTKFVSSIYPSDGSLEADVLSVHFRAAMDHVLAEFVWPFAVKRAYLAVVGENLVTNWGYVYAVPADCLRIHGILVPGTRLPRLEQSVPYETAHYNGAKVILTDLPEAEVLYTGRITNTGLLEPMFVTAFVNYLASRIAMPLAHGDLANNLLQGYYALASQACGVARGESNTGPLPVSDLEAYRS